MHFKKKEKTVEVISENEDIRAISVYNISGCIVKNWKGDATDKVDIDMQNLNPGIYFFRVNNENIKLIFQ